MPPALTGPVLVGAVLLALAAPGKWRRPASTSNALRALGLPAGDRLVRLIAVGEAGLAVAVLVVPAPVVLVLLGLAYAAFAGVVVAALRSGSPLSSCGCFGRPDTPPTLVHLVVVAALGLAAFTAAFTGSASLADLLASPGAGLPLLLGVAVSTLLAWAALSVVPQTRAGTQSAARSDDLFRVVAR